MLSNHRSKVLHILKKVVTKSTGPPMTENSKPARTTVRFAVTDASSEDIEIARLFLTKAEGEPGNLKYSANDEKSMKRVGAAISACHDVNILNLDDPSSAAAKAFAREGLSVFRLPDGDFSVTFEYDTKHNRMIGAQKALHKQAAIPSDISKKIYESIQSVMEKFPTELAEEIEAAIEKDDPQSALEAVKNAQSTGAIQIAPSLRLLTAIQRIPTEALSTDDIVALLKMRVAIATALGEYVEAAESAENLLMIHGDSIDADTGNELKLVVGIGALSNGLTETALAIWRELLNSSNSINPDTRGWGWRNISIVLKPNDTEAKDAARYSADAFLEAGLKHEAAGSLLLLIDCLVHEQPAKAISAFDEVIDIINNNGLNDQDLLAGVYFERAKHFQNIGEHELAFNNACEAENLWKNLIGCEERHVASLNLAAIEAKILGKNSSWEYFHNKSIEIGNKYGDFRSIFSDRLSILFEEYNDQELQKIEEEAIDATDIELLACVRVVQATASPTLSFVQRLKILESTLKDVTKKKGKSAIDDPIQMGIAKVLMNEKQYRRAVGWLRKILANNPLNSWARGSLVQCLWNDENWGDAAIFLSEQIQKFGELPALLYAYGRSLSEAGDFPQAIQVLTRSMELLKETEELYADCNKVRESALRLTDGAIPKAKDKNQPISPVTKSDLEEALAAFSKFVSADKRMAFWTKPKNAEDHKWVSKPEEVAQNLLHTFLKAWFQDKIMIFEELNAGAGRLDLFLQLFGGLSAILELKMCGFGYSTNYAAAGEQQIFHYLGNKNTKLGFLVVFDGRLRSNSKRLLGNSCPDNYTVLEIISDVRPRVTMNTRSRKK